MRKIAHFITCCALVGCVSEPPTYEDTQKIPPFILVEKTIPPPWVFRRIAENEPHQQSFHVVYYSEDLGDPVQALVYVDTLPGDSPPQADAKTDDATVHTLPENVEQGAPGSFGDERYIDFDIADFTPGCHAVSVLLTHSSNIVGSTISNKDLVARVVWWFDVEGTLDPVVSDCPTLGIGPISDQ
jgi:hypothetical protein